MSSKLCEILENAKSSAASPLATASPPRIGVPVRTQICGDLLEWTDDETGWGLRSGKKDGSCLRRFIRLADQPDAQIAQFAQDYGVLSLGTGGFPVAKADLPSRVDEDYPPIVGPTVGKTTLITPRRWRQEPIAGWRAWSRYVHLVLMLSYALKQGEKIARDYHLRIVGFDPGPDDPDLDDDSPYIKRWPDGKLQLSDLGETVYDRLWPWRLMQELGQYATVEEQWQWLMQDVSVWLLRQVEYEVRLNGRWDAPRIVLDRPLHERWPLDGRSVHYALSTIVEQLIRTILGGMNVCRDCWLAYPVERRRQNGRCPECARLASNKAARQSKARSRAREAATNVEVSGLGKHSSVLP
jgi:hypothetical protein